MEGAVVELAVLAGDSTTALVEAERMLAEGSEGLTDAHEAMLLRLRGYTFMQTGELEQARDALDRSVERAREGNTEYQLALSLQARARWAAQAGAASAEDEAESVSLFDRLGVVATLPMP